MWFWQTLLTTLLHMFVRLRVALTKARFCVAASQQLIGITSATSDLCTVCCQ